MRQSREDVVEEDPSRWHGQGLHVGTLGKRMRKRKTRRHLLGDYPGHGHRAGGIPRTC